jgi:hypothetical protein
MEKPFTKSFADERSDGQMAKEHSKILVAFPIAPGG